jgi:dTDP-4-dehydrorhamnose reductase
VTATLLITGAHGQLGRSLTAECALRRIDCEGRDVDTLDITSAEAVEQWITDREPAAVINCAAFTAVDDCETDLDTAMAVNGEAVGHIAAACNGVAARLIQISTDYVFRGDGDRPYTETDPVGPVTAYGLSKLRGEEMARTATHHLLIRTAWLFGRGGHNFVEAIRSQIEGGRDHLEVVDDQRGCPTFSDDLACTILDLLELEVEGVVHAVNSGSSTWHGFAVEIVERLGANVAVEKITSDRHPRPAQRPTNSMLDTTRLESLLGRSMPEWQDALARYLAGS